MGNLLAQAQRMQKALEDARAELRDVRIEGSAGGGVVRAVVDGMGTVHGVHLTDEALSGADRTLVEEMLKGALVDAQTRAKREHDERLAKVTGGMDMPGLL